MDSEGYSVKRSTSGELDLVPDINSGSLSRCGVTAARSREFRGKSLRPLLIVEAANPEWTSVPLVGWNLARAISSRTNALIVTQARNRGAFLRAGLVPDRDFLIVDNERVAGALHRLSEFVRGGTNKGWTAVTALASLAYYSFEWEVWRLLRERLIDGEFDLVHRITPLSPTSQSWLAPRLKRLGIPFVLGPLNGGLPWPENFLEVRGKEKDRLSMVRGAFSLMPYYSATRRHAAALIAGSRFTMSEFPQECEDRAFLIPENAADPDRFPFQQRDFDGRNLSVAFVGRLVPYKGADMLIEAVARYMGPLKIDVLIIGDGPQREELERQVQARGLQGKVRFAGWVEQKDLAAAVSECQVLASSSVREFGGGAVLEAMCLGLVPIVADYGGPAELIDATSGIAVPFKDRETLIDGFAKAFETLERHPARIAALSAGAGARVRQKYTWNKKASEIVDIYAWVLGGASACRSTTLSFGKGH
ncbi:glycosyltransferase [Rhizobium sp. NTR19]|uniref:Glycosyltransferase n=1 Tax=Neorhizobium turbinariae TaxID=2937795 RepID=A0ABT0IX29_9HYPH|nr:glycosyltransferase [Neorhizobium turbinariae]MCK8782442.1 glycosyltransferase [Neorhizobium turbinariae]